MEQSNRRSKYLIISFSLFLIGLLSITYGFFNYTRTGNLNNLGTGRIYFNSEQNGSISMTNVFPMTSSEAINANLDTITIDIVGDTTYIDGEEFEVSFVDVTNTINGKQIPISYIASYTANTGNSIGAESDTYWESRESKNADIYTLTEIGNVKEGKQVLVGFIKNSATGINGTLTIKAYIDADRMVITDTYPSGKKYELNQNMTNEEINDCVSYLTSLGMDQYLQTGETLNNFCAGTGTMQGIRFQEYLNQEEYSYIRPYLQSHNIIHYLGEYRTTSEWVNGREVFTTSEWNSLSNTPISFKLRVESNEGIWVEKSIKEIDSCPNCVYVYTEEELWTTWNTNGQTPSVLTSSDYSIDYEDVIASSGNNYFLGLILNSSNQIERAFSCGLYNDITPFCIEGFDDGTKYEANQEMLLSSEFWDNTCNVQEYDIGSDYEETYCDAPENGMVYALITSIGGAFTGIMDVSNCVVGSNGSVYCSSSP